MADASELPATSEPLEPSDAPEAPPAPLRLPALGPLLDGGALFGIATQLLAARRRLALRTGGAIPTVGELALGLRMYVAHCDAARAPDTALPGPPVPAPPPSPRASAPRASPRIPLQPGTSLEPVGGALEGPALGVELPSPLATRGAQLELRELLRLADLTYATRAELCAHAAEAPRFRVLSARWAAGKWAPAYFLAWFPDTRVLLLSVRGSKETSDLLTNLTVETEPFLGGLAHRGVVESARRLHRALAPALDAHAAAHDVARFLLVGHSLGGAVATALALLLRGGAPPCASPSASGALPATPPPSPSASADRGGGKRPGAGPASGGCAGGGRDVLRQARCVAFGAPPFLSRGLAARAAAQGVTTVVCGLDAVPRLSAGSLDRFLLAVTRHDWAPQVGVTIERAAGAFLGPGAAAALGEFLARRGAPGAAWAVSALGSTARRALEASRAATNRSTLWEGALAAGALASSLVGSQFLHAADRPPARQPDYAFARQFGMSGDDVERLLVDDAPPEMFLAGEILHFDVPFVSAAEFAQTKQIPRGQVRRASMDDFGDVEASAWMIYHHHPRVLFDQIGRMLEADSEEEDS